MATLSSSIVKHGLASMKDVEEALARQVLYGGDLATNLLEVTEVSEEALTRLLAESHGLPAAPAGELPHARSETLALVPGEVARRHGAYPLDDRDGTLVMAVSEPLPREVEEDLGFALGVEVDQRVAPAVRIQQAIARDYGLPVDRRSLRLIARLSGLPDPSPSSLPSPGLGGAQMPRLPRPPSLPPLSYPLEAPRAPAPPASPEGPVSLRPVALERRMQETPGESPPAPPARAVTPTPPVAAPELAAWATQAGRSARARTRRRGPYTAAMAERDLSLAEGRDDVLRAAFDFMAQYFEYSALFAVHADIAEGRDARGPGAGRAQITGVGVPLDLPSALATARDEGALQLSRLSTDGIDRALAKDLSRAPGRVALFLPIVVRGRCVLILYGDHGAQDVELGEVGDVIAFAPLVTAALERVIVRRKRGETGHPPRVRRERRHAPRPSRDERAAAFVQALSLPSPAAPSPAAPSLAASSPEPPPRSPRLSNRVISVGAERRASTPPQGTPRALETSGALELAIPLTRPSNPAPRAHIEEPPEDGWEVASPRGFSALEAATSPGVGPARAVGSRPPSSQRLELVPETALDEPDGPDLSFSEEEMSESELLGAEQSPVAPLRRHEIPLAAPSRSESFPPRRPRPRYSSEELRLPSVIVDLESDCRDLVTRLLDGDELAAERLVELGQPAIAALVAQFPGPVETELGAGRGGRASEAGPILRTLRRFGHEAVPFLVVRTADTSPDVRSWATRLLGELPSADSARAVLRRVIDPEPEVHRAALAASRLLFTDSESREALRDGLCVLAADVTQSDEVRHTAIEALAELREARAVPRLIRLLEGSNPDIVKSAEWALTVLTRQSFRRDSARWLEWWNAHASEHRIEWLIDALVHESPELRRAAGEELKSETKEYFGFYDDLPPSERARARERYREWWDSKGKARFPRT